MKHPRKLLALLLALAMVMTLLPAQAFAEGDDPPPAEEKIVLDGLSEPAALPPADEVQEYYSGTCGDLDWELEDGVLTISGTGQMTNYSSSSHPSWYDYRTSITTVVIGSGAVNVGSYAFHGGTTGANYPNLTSVSIPDTVKTVGSYAFYNCKALADAELPAGLQALGGSSFSGTALTAVTIPASLVTFDSDVFRSCTSLQSLTIEDGVTKLGMQAFLSCTALESVTIPGSVTYAGNSTFKNCTSLQNVTLSEGLTTLGYSMFSGCTSLAGITLPESLTEVPYMAFANCTALTKITFPVHIKFFSQSRGNEKIPSLQRLSAGTG